MEIQVKLQLHINPEQKLFTGHGEGYVAINGERHSQSVVVMANEIRSDWNASAFESLALEHFDYFVTLKPEVLLFGTGAKQRFGHPQLYRNLLAAGIGIEFMDTPAACRTYNILVAEDRKVVAAILI
jgi:uncharacterized protein